MSTSLIERRCLAFQSTGGVSGVTVWRKGACPYIPTVAVQVEPFRLTGEAEVWLLRPRDVPGNDVEGAEVRWRAQVRHRDLSPKDS